MTKEQLTEKLKYFLNGENHIGGALYFVLNEEGGQVIRFVDTVTDVQTKIKEQYLEYLHEKFLATDGWHYQNISNSDERKNSVYEYDLEDRPEGLDVLKTVRDNGNLPKFNFSNESLSNLDGYLITLGNEANKIVLYKKHHPINMLRRDSRLFLIPADERFVQISGDALALDKSFDFMLVDETLVILRLKILERFFGFDKVIERQATGSVEQIQTLGLIENIEELTEMVSDKAYAKKLMSVRNSPVLSLPVATVIAFAQRHPVLKKKIKLSEDGLKIKLDTKVSKQQLIKLLNDDYLKSGLTELDYDSLAKDALTAEE